MLKRLLLGSVFSLAILGHLIWRLSKEGAFVSYYLPHEIQERAPDLLRTKKVFQIAGLVEEETLKKVDQNRYTFILTDMEGVRFSVDFEGVLPDLFKEGQGVVVEGHLVHFHFPEASLKSRRLIVSHGNVYDTEKEHREIQKRFIRQSLLKQKISEAL